MKRSIAQELHIEAHDNMKSSELFYYAAYVKDVWKKKEEAIKKGEIYIGG